MRWLFLLLIASPAHAASVIPNFTSGTITSETTSRTEVTEIMNVIEYSNATSYTASGTNITFSGVPSIGAGYSIVVPGQAFQFSETMMTPGIASESSIQRTTIIDSTTNSISVFTQ
tara:strand:+ start:2431 stop:2778 length:348 start_codon:yes stop_codon:yes gene_type:complete